MSRAEQLERQGRFIKAEEVRTRKVRTSLATRKKQVISEPQDGSVIASEIIALLKASIFNVLSEKDLNTAIFYIEKMAEVPLQSLQEVLASSIQEVLDKKGENFEKE